MVHKCFNAHKNNCNFFCRNALFQYCPALSCRDMLLVDFIDGEMYYHFEISQIAGACYQGILILCVKCCPASLIEKLMRQLQSPCHSCFMSMIGWVIYSFYLLALLFVGFANCLGFLKALVEMLYGAYIA